MSQTFHSSQDDDQDNKMDLEEDERLRTGFQGEFDVELEKLTGHGKPDFVPGYCREDFAKYEKILPYADAVVGEAHQRLEEIKKGMAESLYLREVGYGLQWWIKQLSEYLGVHNFQFPFDDHVKLCKFLYEVSTIPDLDFTIQERFFRMLRRLLLREDILPVGSMVLDWKPLFKIIEHLYFSVNRVNLSIQKEHGEALCGVVVVCRRFFPLSATEEILKEFRPMLCPQDISLCTAVTFLVLFLPTGPGHPHHLWIEEMWNLWGWIENMKLWDCMFIMLFDRLVQDNYGRPLAFDFQAILDELFVRFLRVLALPVGRARTPRPHYFSEKYASFQPDTDKCSTMMFSLSNLVVHLIVPNQSGDGLEPKCLTLLRKLFHAIESFYHPSNSGRWTQKLCRLVYNLGVRIQDRLDLELKNKVRYEKKYFLTQKIIDEFVNIIMPCTLLSLYGKGSHMVMAGAQVLKYCVCLSPEQTFPKILERIYPALETLTETHQTLASMVCMSLISSHLFNASLWKTGATHLLPLLQLTLPGIDMNDPMKTEATLKFYLATLVTIPIVDVSRAINDSMTEQEVQIAQSSVYLEEWALAFLEKLFTACEHYIYPGKNQKSKFVLGLQLVGGVFFNQLSPEIHHQASQRVFRFITSKLLMAAKKPVSVLVTSACSTGGAKTLKMFIPFLADRVIDTSSLQHDEEADTEMVWDLHMLTRVVRLSGVHLLDHKEILLSVLRVTKNSSAKKIVKLSGKLLKSILKSLTFTYPLETRSLNADEFKNLSTNYVPWGKTYTCEEVKIEWHVPSTAELDFANALLTEFVSQIISSLKDSIEPAEEGSEKPVVTSDEKRTKKFQIWKNLQMLKSIRIGTCGTLESRFEISDPNIDGPDIIPRRFPSLVQDGMKKRILVTSCPQNISDPIPSFEIGPLLIRICDFLCEHYEDDTKLFKLLTKTYVVFLNCYVGGCTQFLISLKRVHKNAKMLTRNFLDDDRRCRFIWVTRAHIQHLTRLSKNYHLGFCNSMHLKMFRSLLKLSVNPYSDVRKHGQAWLFYALLKYRRAKAYILEDLLEMFQNPLTTTPKEGDTEPAIEAYFAKGILYSFLHPFFMKMVIYNWEYSKKFFTSLIVVGSKFVSNPRVHALITKVYILFCILFYTASISFTVPEHVLSAAQRLLPVGSPPPSLERQKEAIAICEKNNKLRLKSYTEMNEAILETVSTENVHYRFEIMAYTCLFFLLRSEQPISESVIKWFLKGLVSEFGQIRKVAMKALQVILAVQKISYQGKNILDLSSSREILPPSFKYEFQRESRLVLSAILSSSPTSASTSASASASVATIPLTSSSNTITISSTSPLPFTHLPPVEMTKELYNSSVFCDKSFYGWAALPHKAKFYEANKANNNPKEYSSSKQLVFDTMTKEFISRFINFLDQENHTVGVEAEQRSDHFNESCVQMYKGLFRNYGIVMFHLFKPEITRLIATQDQHSHRVAAEIIAGLVRGSKHWDYDDIIEMKTFLSPLLNSVLHTMQRSMRNDWASCLCYCVYDRDPRRLFWLRDVILSVPNIDDVNISVAEESRRFDFYRVVIEEMSWRCLGESKALLVHIEENLSHPYKFVREKMGRALFVIFLNYWAPNNDNAKAKEEEEEEPLANFIDKVFGGRLFLKSDEGLPAVASPSTPSTIDTASLVTTATISVTSTPFGNTPRDDHEDGKGNSAMDIDIDGEDDDEEEDIESAQQTKLEQNEEDVQERNFKACNTVLTWLCLTFNAGQSRTLYRHLPVIMKDVFRMVDEGHKEILVAHAKLCLGLLAQSLFPVDVLQTILDFICSSPPDSWHIKMSILSFLQVLVFRNLFQISQQNLKKIIDFLVALLEDSQVEVRELSAVTLGGIFRCDSRCSEFDLQSHFQKLAKTRIIRIKRVNGTYHRQTRGPEFIRRHAGVLGMAAVINAYPYDIPLFLPNLLCELGDHVGDPPPIQATVKKTLSEFWRTHQDNWRYFKTMFTEDQVVTLTDLLISPSYYA